MGMGTGMESQPTQGGSLYATHNKMDIFDFMKISAACITHTHTKANDKLIISAYIIANVSNM